MLRKFTLVLTSCVNSNVWLPYLLKSPRLRKVVLTVFYCLGEEAAPSARLVIEMFRASDCSDGLGDKDFLPTITPPIPLITGYYPLLALSRCSFELTLRSCSLLRSLRSPL